MITSKFIFQILDSYSSSKKLKDELVTVYENPTSSDIAEIIKDAKRSKRNVEYIRFLADAKDQKVYIADDYLVTHNEMCAMVGIPNEAPWVRTGGAARPENNKLRLMKWSMKSFSPESLKYKWDFVSKYIQGWSEALASGRWIK